MKFKPDPKKLFKKISIPVLQKKLDKVFQEYIRLRDEGKPCISSGKYSKLQAGHYHSRKFLAIRWDERNCNGQSEYDNLFNQGNFHGYTKGMLKKYGQKVIDELEIKRHNKVKMSAFEYQFLIEEYTTKVKNLKLKHENRNF